MKLITIAIEGVTPLLMNAPGQMMLDMANGSIKTKKSILGPAEEAEMGTYRNSKGNLCFPTAAFRGAVIGGAKGRTVGRTGLGTILMGSVFPMDATTDLFDPRTKKPLRNYEIDIRRVVLNKTSAIMRSRPRLDNWSANVRLEVDPDFTDEEVVRQMLQIGGSRVGIGNYRPEKSGTFGRFKVL